MLRAAVVLSGLLLAVTSNSVVLAKGHSSEDKQVAQEQSREEKAKKKHEQSATAQSNKSAPAIHFHGSHHSAADTLWSHPKRSKDDPTSLLFRGQ